MRAIKTLALTAVAAAAVSAAESAAGAAGAEAAACEWRPLDLGRARCGANAGADGAELLCRAPGLGAALDQAEVVVNVLRALEAVRARWGVHWSLESGLEAACASDWARLVSYGGMSCNVSAPRDHCEALLGSTLLGSTLLGSTLPGSAQLGSPRLGPTLLDSGLLDASNFIADLASIGEETSSAWNWQALVAGLLVDGFGFLVLGSCLLVCRSGRNVTGLEYDYAQFEESIEDPFDDSERGAPLRSVDQQQQHQRRRQQHQQQRQPLLSPGYLRREASTGSATPAPGSARSGHSALQRKLSLLSNDQARVLSPRLLYPSSEHGEEQQLSRAAVEVRNEGEGLDLEGHARFEAHERAEPPSSGRARLTDRSIFAHSHLNCFLRWLLPVMLVGSLTLFAVAAMYDGTKVVLYIKVGRHEVPGITLSDFTLVESIRKMCDAGVYPLAALTLVWSGIWPYLRQVLLLTCYFVGPRHFSVARRAGLLHLLDIMGKWFFLNTVLSVRGLCLQDSDVYGTDPMVPLLPGPAWPGPALPCPEQ
jgi:hypothetical protein